MEEPSQNKKAVTEILFISQEDLSNADSGAKIRNRSIVEALRSLPNINLTIAQPSPSGDINLGPNIRKSIPLYARLLSIFTKYEVNPFISGVPNEEFDIIIVSYTYYAYVYAYLKDKWPSAYIILDCHNIESDLKFQILRNDVNIGNIVKYLSILATEKKYFHLYNELWLTSETDLQTAVTRFGAAQYKLRIVPNSIPIPENRYARRRIERRIIFFGWMGTEQNHETAMRLYEIYRRIQHEPWCPEFHIAGKNPSPILSALSNDRFRVRGGFASLDDLLAIGFDLLVMPMDLGGGTRLKVLDAAASYLPILSTAKGVEGLDLVPDVHFLLAESTEEFIASLQYVYTLPEHEALAWLENLVKEAFNMVDAQYSTKALSQRLAKVVEGL